MLAMVAGQQRTALLQRRMRQVGVAVEAVVGLVPNTGGGGARSSRLRTADFRFSQCWSFSALLMLVLVLGFTLRVQGDWVLVSDCVTYAR